MFLYASLRGIAHHLKRDLWLEISAGFDNDAQYQRIFLLDRLSLNHSMLHKDSWLGKLHLGWMGKILRRLGNPLKGSKCFWSEDPAQGFVEFYKLRGWAGHTILAGYFQSPRYFEAIQEEIRSEFQISHPIGESTLAEADRIRKMICPIMVGIRRYEEAPLGAVPLTAEYYQKTMSFMHKQYPLSTFVVFSTDVEWVRQNLSIPGDHYFVEPKPENKHAHEDLYLMALCQHYIISNSSYYWWGCWLSQNSEKVVLCPNVGFSNPDVYPLEWTVVSQDPQEKIELVKGVGE